MSADLSDREKACLSWTALGKSSWGIGRLLCISENTVIFHIKNAMRKLGTSRRTLAAFKAVQLGLIDPEVEAGRTASGGFVTWQPSDLIGDKLISGVR